MDFTKPSQPDCLLVDNGSLQPAPTLALRRLAGALEERIGWPVAPVSLLHSNKVPSKDLGGRPAEIFDAVLRQSYGTGVRRFLVLPLFFGPSGALTDYMPGKLKLIAAELGPLEVTFAAPVVGEDASRPDPRIAAILVDHARMVIRDQGLSRPVVVLVDHGSPQRAETAGRDAIALQMADELGDAARAVIAASMERRAGPEYDFNEPLLDRALAGAPCGDGAGNVVIAPLFFSHGRHAGPRGDIETIARTAETRHSGLRVHLARVVGEHPRLIEILADRYAEANRRTD